MRLALVAAVLGSLALLVNPAPAFAHADVHASSPRNGAHLSLAPKRIVVTFSEDIAFDSQQPRLIDGTGRTVPSTSAVSGAVLTITPSRPLGRGITTAAWRVASDDGHRVSGALAFTVGREPARGRRTTVATTPRIPTNLSGDRPGTLTLTMASKARSGEVTWTSDALPGPLIWAINGDGVTAEATGVLPLAGTWRLTALLITSSSQIVMSSGSVVIRAQGAS